MSIWIFHTTEVDILFKVAFSSKSGQGLVVNAMSAGMTLLGEPSITDITVQMWPLKMHVAWNNVL